MTGNARPRMLLIYDLDGWVQPDGCRCTFQRIRARSRVFWGCPWHGINSGPVMGPPDWPPIRTVVEDDPR